MNNNKGVSHTISKLYPYIKNCRWIFVVGLSSMLLIAVMAVGLGQAMKYLIENIPDASPISSDYYNTALIGAMLAIGLYCMASYARIFSIRLIAVRVTGGLRKDIFAKIIEVGPNYIESQTSGSIQTRIMSDTEELGGFFAQQIPLLIKSVLMLISGILACFYVNAGLSIIVLIGIPLIILPFIISAAPLRNMGAELQESFAAVGSFAGETFRHVKLVYAFGRSQVEIKKFSEYVESSSDLAIRSGRRQIWLGVFVESLCFVFFAVLFYFAAKKIGSGIMTIGSLVAFGFYVQAIVISAKNIVNVMSSLNFAIGTATRVVEYLDLDNEMSQRGRDAPLPDNLGCRIEFKDVYFSYPSRPQEWILKGLNLVIESRTRVAIVGPSGAGKTTVLELLLGIYEPQQGTITIDGVDIKSVSPADICARIGYMPQQASLRTGNVIDNIRYGNMAASVEDVRLAAKRAHADTFIEKLPHAYETDLGEVGSRLSGGQKQRISLARALLVKPKILILDEPTSALDEESERNVEEALAGLTRERKTTIINITHSISSAILADSILVMKDGAVVGSGKHQDLLEECLVYSNLVVEEAL